jgi:hypothetical protein
VLAVIPNFSRGGDVVLNLKFRILTAHVLLGAFVALMTLTSTTSMAASGSANICEALFAPAQETNQIMIGQQHLAIIQELDAALELGAAAKTQHDLNEATHALVVVMNEVLDQAVSDALMLMYGSSQMAPAEKAGTANGMRLMVGLIAERFGLSSGQVTQLLEKRLAIATQELPKHDPIGFILPSKNESSAQTASIPQTLRPGFNSHGASYEIPYGRAAIPNEAPPSLGPKAPIGFIYSKASASMPDSKGNLGFDVVDRKFVDDAFSYAVEVDPKSGEFTLVKIPLVAKSRR